MVRRSTKRETPTRTGLPRARASRYFVFPSPTSPLSLCLHPPSGSPLTIFLSLNVLYFGPTTTTTTTSITTTLVAATERATLGLLRATSLSSLSLPHSSVHYRCPSSPPPVSLLSSFRLFRFDSRNGSASRCRWVNTNRRAGDLCMGWS